MTDTELEIDNMTNVQQWADWAYAKEENMYFMVGDRKKYNPEAARLATHLAMGSTDEEARPSCISPKVEIFVNGKLWRSTEEWKVIKREKFVY